jgi:hypothetical protein
LSLFFQIGNCCDFEIQKESSTLLDSLIGLSNGNEFWEQYEEKDLPNYKGRSYRIFEHHWMEEETKIYRISETESGFSLIFKDYKDGRNLNEYYFLDSLVTYFEIPLNREEIERIDNLFKQNCFWTHPFKRPKKGIILHLRHHFIEAFSSKGNECTGKNYHFVDMLQNPNVNFEVIIEELENMVKEHKLTK